MVSICQVVFVVISAMCVAVHDSELECYVGTKEGKKHLEKRVAPDGYFCTFTVDTPCNWNGSYSYDMQPSDKKKDFCKTEPPLACYCNSESFCNRHYKTMKQVWMRDSKKVSNISIRDCMQNFLNNMVFDDPNPEADLEHSTSTTGTGDSGFTGAVDSSEGADTAETGSGITATNNGGQGGFASTTTNEDDSVGGDSGSTTTIDGGQGGHDSMTSKRDDSAGGDSGSTATNNGGQGGHDSTTATGDDSAGGGSGSTATNSGGQGDDASTTKGDGSDTQGLIATNGDTGGDLGTETTTPLFYESTTTDEGSTTFGGNAFHRMRDGSQTRPDDDDGDRDYFWLIFFTLAAVALILIVCVIPILILLATTKYSKMKKGAKTKRNSQMRPKQGAPMKPGKGAGSSNSNSKSALMQSNSKSQSSGEMKKGKKFQ